MRVNANAKDKLHDVAAFVQDGMADTADVFHRSVWTTRRSSCRSTRVFSYAIRTINVLFLTSSFLNSC